MWAEGWGVGGVGGWGVGDPLVGKIRQVVFDGFPYIIKIIAGLLLANFLMSNLLMSILQFPFSGSSSLSGR